MLRVLRELAVQAFGAFLSRAARRLGLVAAQRKRAVVLAELREGVREVGDLQPKAVRLLFLRCQLVQQPGPQLGSLPLALSGEETTPPLALPGASNWPECSDKLQLIRAVSRKR